MCNYLHFVDLGKLLVHQYCIKFALLTAYKFFELFLCHCYAMPKSSISKISVEPPGMPG